MLDKSYFKPCDKITNKIWWLTIWNFTDIQCLNISDNIAKTELYWWNINSKIHDNWGWVYSIYLHDLLKYINADSTMSDTEILKSISDWKNQWLTMGYSIYLPWTIIYSDIWITNKNNLSFSIYDIINKPNVYIKFHMENNEENTNKKLINLKSKIDSFKLLINWKYELQKTVKWKKDVIKFDKIISKVNDEKLISIYNLISKINLNFIKKNKYIITYLEWRIWTEIYKRELDKKNVNNDIEINNNNYYLSKWRIFNNNEVVYWTDIVNWSISEFCNWLSSNYSKQYKYIPEILWQNDKIIIFNENSGNCDSHWLIRTYILLKNTWQKYQFLSLNFQKSFWSWDYILEWINDKTIILDNVTGYTVFNDGIYSKDYNYLNKIENAKHIKMIQMSIDDFLRSWINMK